MHSVNIGIYTNTIVKRQHKTIKTMKLNVITLFLMLFLVIPTSARADILGKVISITDGDTLTIIDNRKNKYKIRLAEIDTPEKNQPYGTKAQQALSDMVFAKYVRADIQTKDRYGRHVAHIYLGSLHVNKEMVNIGAAWVYRKYLKDQSLLAIEQDAKDNKRGLWGLSEAERTPPWEWRLGHHRNEHNSKHMKEIFIECGNKKYCREMKSCEEAHFYLDKCGLDTIDGGKDGIPCEKLCSK